MENKLYSDMYQTLTFQLILPSAFTSSLQRLPLRTKDYYKYQSYLSAPRNDALPLSIFIPSSFILHPFSLMLSFILSFIPKSKIYNLKSTFPTPHPSPNPTPPNQIEKHHIRTLHPHNNTKVIEGEGEG